MGTAWRMLARRRDLRLLLSAGMVSLSGDWILRIGLIYRVYVVTGSTVVSALLMASSFAPQVLLGAVAGVYADRWDRKRTMIAANLLLAAGLLPLLLVHGAGGVWIVLAVMFWEGSVQQFFSPAQQAMVPRLVPDDELLPANAVSGQISDASRLAGSAAGGIIGAAGGIAAVTLTDAASFIISAGLLTLVRTSGRTAPGGPAGLPVRAWLAQVGAEMRDGLRLSARNRVLRALMVFALVTSVGEGIMSTLFVPFVEHVLHGTSQEYGLVVAAQAVGGIAGGIVAAACAHRVRAARLLGIGATVFGLVDLAIFLYPLGYIAVWPAAVGMIIVGVPGALCIAGLVTLFQRSSADAYRGRIFGAVATLEGVTILAGTLGAGYLSRSAGIIGVLAIQGGAYVVAGLAMLAWLKDTPGTPAGALSSVPEVATSQAANAPQACPKTDLAPADLAPAVNDGQVSERVIEEQIQYYRRRAAEYDATADGPLASARERITRVSSAWPVAGPVLELACGTGMWTQMLAGRAAELTAIDSSPEAIEIARRRCPASVRFSCADILHWAPDRHYQLVFFGFWLSHVPSSRLGSFFGMLRQSLTPAGEVIFVDEHVSQASHEQPTADPELVTRCLSDGTRHQVVKVFLDPPRLAAHLDTLGWDCELKVDGEDWVIGRARPRE